MGKKKSNSGKQRQTKARQHQRNNGKPSLMGGVAVTKGFSGKFQQQAKHQQHQQQLVGTKGQTSSSLSSSSSSSQKVKTNSSSRINNNSSNKNIKTSTLPSPASSPTSFTNMNNDGAVVTMNISRSELLHKLRMVQQPKVFLSPPQHPTATSGGCNHIVTSLQPRVRSRTDHDSDNGNGNGTNVGVERVEFEKQIASLHERQWAAAQHKNRGSSKKTKTGGTKRGKQSSSSSRAGGTDKNNNTHSPGGEAVTPNSPFAFQPASFSVDKSTQDLLQETMHQMVHMTGVGISAVEKTPIRSNKTVTDAYDDYSFDEQLGQEQQFLPTMMLSAPSTVSSTSSSSVQQQQQQLQREPEHGYAQYQLLQTHSTNNSNNPFGALETGDSDDDDEKEGQGGFQAGNGNRWSRLSSTTIQQSSISFAPASFSLMHTQTPTPASTPTTQNYHPNRNIYGEAVEAVAAEAGGTILPTIQSGGGSSLSMALQIAIQPPNLLPHQHQNHHQQQQHRASGLFGGNTIHAPPSIGRNEDDDTVDPDL
jgi:hypothetical protein